MVFIESYTRLFDLYVRSINIEKKKKTKTNDSWPKDESKSRKQEKIYCNKLNGIAEKTNTPLYYSISSIYFSLKNLHLELLNKWLYFMVSFVINSVLRLCKFLPKRCKKNYVKIFMFWILQIVDLIYLLLLSFSEWWM